EYTCSVRPNMPSHLPDGGVPAATALPSLNSPAHRNEESSDVMAKRGPPEHANGPNDERSCEHGADTSGIAIVHRHAMHGDVCGQNATSHHRRSPDCGTHINHRERRITGGSPKVRHDQDKCRDGIRACDA